MRQLDGIRGRCSTGDARTQAQHKPAPGELAHVVGGCLYRSPYQHNHTADKDGPAPAPAVGEEATEWKGSDLAQVVRDEDDAGGRALAGETEGGLVGFHGVDGALDIRFIRL